MGCMEDPRHDLAATNLPPSLGEKRIELFDRVAFRLLAVIDVGSGILAGECMDRG